MSLVTVISQFFHDQLLTYFLTLVALDIAFGVLAALKTHTFSLHRVGDFARDDVLFKLVPWFVLYAGDKISGSADVAAGIDTGVVAGVVYAFVVAQIVASLLKSVKELFPELPIPAAIAGPRT